MHNRDKTADDADDAPLEAKLDGGRIHAKDTVPEKDGFRQNE